jgi:hypothetical protein
VLCLDVADQELTASFHPGEHDIAVEEAEPGGNQVERCRTELVQLPDHGVVGAVGRQPRQ